ncbi:MAG: sugar ABC transporter ATP-binding protein, partial [Bacteriovoracia bacterium]
LSVGAQQMVEIAKALTRRSRVLILDEPTSALTPSEVEALFVVIRKLKAQGKGLVYISHKMEEIYAIADRITVLRDGKSVTTAPTAGLPERQLIAHMVGRSLDRAFPDRPPFVTGVADTLLSVHEFSGFGKSTLGSAGAGPVSGMRRLFGPLSFELKRGEILGFAGLLGAGRTDLMEALFGNAQRIQTEGEVKIGGTSVRVRTPGEGLRNRLAFVSEDRKHQSILPKRSLTENVTLSRLTLGGLFRVLDGAREAKLADVSLRRFRTRCTGPAQEIQTLSGGNQQKAVIGRALQTNPDIIILDEPTRGIDVAAKYEIYEILFDLAAQGKGLLVVSSDLPEAMGLCDRIIVLNQGEYMGCLSRHEFSQPAIMELAIGRTHGRR